jgi:hypothetical protein
MDRPALPPLSEVLKAHRQFPGDFCSVSALEFVSKCYGLTKLDQFPLQSDPQNEKKGFGEPILQSLVSLEGSEEHYDIPSALALIEKEMSADRFLAVSLRGFLVFGQIVIPAGYHILVAARVEGLPTLIDPATKQVLARAKEELTKVLEWNSRHNPERTTIHILSLVPKK